MTINQSLDCHLIVYLYSFTIVKVIFVLIVGYYFKPNCWLISYLRKIWNESQSRFSWFPSWSHERNHNLVFEWLHFAHFFEHKVPRMKLYIEWIVTFDGMNKSIGHWFLFVFLLESTENPIPNDQNPSVIFIDIFWISS